MIRSRQSAGFVGRDRQLAEFAANLARPVWDPQRRFVFCVHGVGGVGKTSLVRQLQRMARERGAACAYVDESVTGVPEMMARIASQLSADGSGSGSGPGSGPGMRDFTRQYERYRQRCAEVQSDTGAPVGVASFLTRAAVRVGVSALRGVPGVGGVAEAFDPQSLAEQADRARTYLSGKFRDQDDVRLVLSPVQELSPVFLRDLSALGGSGSGSGSGSGGNGRALALFIDTFEFTGRFAQEWLLEVLGGAYGPLCPDIVITVAGRDRLDHSAWSAYLSVLAQVPLTVFSDEEARELLAGQGVTGRQAVEVVLGLSSRLPLLVAMLAQHHPDDLADLGDPSGDAVERFLRWEPDPARRALAVDAALPRVVDEDVLATLVRGEPDAARSLFDWLRSLSFVTHEAGRCRYHDVVRATMLRLERGQSPARWRERHERLADLYRSRQRAAAEGEGEAWDDETWRGLRVEQVYHALCANGAAALPGALADVIWVQRLGMRDPGPWLSAIAEAGRDADVALLQRWGARLNDTRLAENPAVALVDLVIREGELDTASLGSAFLLLGQEKYLAGGYEAALADLTRALDLCPADVDCLTVRGETYLVTGRFDAAESDFSRALEVDPDLRRALLNRSEAYWLLGRYEQALADLDRAAGHGPELPWVLTGRGQVHRELGHVDLALADLDRAIAMEPDLALAVGSRGETYRQAGRYEQALADLDHAIALQPDMPWALGSRGRAQLRLGRAQEALADLTRAVEVEEGSAKRDKGAGRRRYDIALALLALGEQEAAAECLSAAAALIEAASSVECNVVRNRMNLLLCRAAQRDHVQAHRLADEVLGLEPGPNRHQIRELAADLGELAEVGGSAVAGEAGGPGRARALLERLA